VCAGAEWCIVELASPHDAQTNCTRYYKLAPHDELAGCLSDGEAEQSRRHDVCLRLTFVRPQRAVTPGQAVVLYGPMLPPPQGRFGSSDLEHAHSSSTMAGAMDAVGVKSHDDDTVICAATIAFPGRSLYEQGTTSE
jgi:hypothetical protein